MKILRADASGKNPFHVLRKYDKFFVIFLIAWQRFALQHRSNIYENMSFNRLKCFVALTFRSVRMGWFTCRVT